MKSTCWRLKRSSWSKNRCCYVNQEVNKNPFRGLWRDFWYGFCRCCSYSASPKDGCAVACGWNHRGSCSIPPLNENLTYTQVFAGGCHTVLLRCDGFAVACGLNDCRQLNICRCCVHPGFCRWSAYSASPKWWQCSCLRTKWTWTVWHSTFGWGSDVHQGICRCCSYSACPKWWRRSCVWMEWMWRMQHSTFVWGCDVYPGFCRLCPYSSPPKWWLCSCLWPEWLRTMCNSVFEVMESVVALSASKPSLHIRFEAARGNTRAGFATLLSSWSWCHHSHMFGLGWAWSAALKGQWSWPCNGHFQATCDEGWWAPVSHCLARWAVVRGSVHCRSSLVQGSRWLIYPNLSPARAVAD